MYNLHYKKRGHSRTIPWIHVNNVTDLNIDCPVWTNQLIAGCPAAALVILISFTDYPLETTYRLQKLTD